MANELRLIAQGGVSGALVALSPDGMLAIDESGCIATVNAEAARLLGHASEDIEGRNLIDLLRSSVRGDGMAWLRDVHGQGGYAEVCAQRADGALSSLQLAVRAIRFQGRLMFACYLRQAHGRRRGDPDTTIAARRALYFRAPEAQRAKVLVDAKPIVYIVDADASFRTSMARLLKHCGWKVQSFAAAHAFLAHAHPFVPACAVLDVDLPDLDGLALHERMAADGACLPIILNARQGDVHMIVNAMKAGAFEFFTRPLSDNAVLASVREAIAFSKSALRQAASERLLEARYVSLTPRERDVMRGVVAGLLNKQVAADLGISEITVKVHRGRVMRKMQAHSFAELVNHAARLGAGVAAHAQ